MEQEPFLNSIFKRSALLLVSIFLTSAYHSLVLAETHLMGFNWGTKAGVDLSIQSAKLDSNKTELGYPIGPTFWESLKTAQFNADHMAGDGLYFSTHPFDSARFGPNLLITELVSSNDSIERFVVGMPAHQFEHVSTQQLPPVIRYRGTWHVIKRLPFENETSGLKIFIRKPTEKDAEMLFLEMNLQQDLAKTISFLKDIATRGTVEENNSTRRFMTRLKNLLIQNSIMTYTHPQNISAEQTSNLSNRLTELLEVLKTKTNGTDVFGLDLKSLIYKSFLDESTLMPKEVKISLFLKDPELSIRLTNGKISKIIFEELPSTKSTIKFLNLRNHLLTHGLPYFDQQTLQTLKSIPLPKDKIFDTKYFNISLFEKVPQLAITEYLEWWKSTAISQTDLDNLNQLKIRINENFENGQLIKSCRTLLK